MISFPSKNPAYARNVSLYPDGVLQARVGIQPKCGPSESVVLSQGSTKCSLRGLGVSAVETLNEELETRGLVAR